MKIANNQIHVWKIELQQPIDRLTGYLSQDEIDRANRFHFDIHRHRFIAGRGALRNILSRYLDIAPREVQFDYADRGKPFLAQSPFHFNVTDSNDLALCAVALNREVGIDIEYINPTIEHAKIAKRFFSPQEHQTLTSLPEEQQCLAFFTCWTRKEAYIKAIGDGLAMALDKFTVSIRPGEPAALLSNEDKPSETSRWKMQPIDVGPDYMATLVGEGQDWEMRWIEEESLGTKFA